MMYQAFIKAFDITSQGINSSWQGQLSPAHAGCSQGGKRDGAGWGHKGTMVASCDTGVHSAGGGSPSSPTPSEQAAAPVPMGQCP